MKNKILCYFFLALFLIACKKDKPSSNSNPTQKQTDRLTNDIPETSLERLDATTFAKNIYTWKKGIDIEQSLVASFVAPKGYKRVEVPSNSFGNWLRHLPLKEKGTPVYYYNGTQKLNHVHEAVIDIDVGKRDLQQCADAVMRLKAEYHYSKQEYDKIHFNFTSGDRVSFSDWMRGRKPVVKGNKVAFSVPQASMNSSYSHFKKYLIQIFNYAGTHSLEKELKKVPVSDIQIGDVFIQGGFPGHAVIVVDVVENTAGEKMFMLAQSYMPAQSIHILQNRNSSRISPWYSTDFGMHLQTPEWTFKKSDLKRF